MATFGIELAGSDIGNALMSRTYLLDRYPDIADQYKTAGLWSWGKGTLYSLGKADASAYSTPVQTDVGGTTWKQCSSGGYFGGAVKTDGTLWMWGRNTSGQVGSGNGYTTHNSTPAQTSSGGSTWKKVSCGYDWAAGLKTDGTLWTWGTSDSYQNGADTTTRSTPVQIGSYTGWTDVGVPAYGGNTIGAMKSDGTLWGWGADTYGQRGAGTTGTQSSPVQFNTGAWKTFAVGGYHTVAIRNNGTLWASGRNDNGQLGIGTVSNVSSIVQVSGGGTNWKQVACGASTTSAIKTDGTLWMWGLGSDGQMGNGTSSNASTPIQTVAAGTNWASVSVGTYHVGAIKTDGTLWLWGNNGNGRLGQSSTTYPKVSSPIQVSVGGNNWKSVFAGVTRTHTIRDDTADFGIGTL